ncbi:DUF4430 domain-containing protein [Brevibacillus fortis]|uniref:DUF4430 domain-containing protein n=1 Tax=Brevibacillus fortis TaxID=2126352 RepID=UPI002E1FF9D2|nr:DUF4430 domain-containing protein [Brevibacillus fortis]
MKRKDWLILLGSLVIIIACLAGFYQYRVWQTATNHTITLAPKPKVKAEGTESFANILITKDFGQETVLSNQVPVKDGDTVMDILKNSGVTITTSYNGGFVDSIGGIASQYRSGDSTSKKVDWFYYVNGLLADVGAAEYPVFSGDQIWWDYHSWEHAIQTSALVGHYPHPFIKGLGEEPASPLLIMYTTGYEQQAKQLVASLKTIRPDVKEPVVWDEQQFSSENALILVGDTKSISQSQNVVAIFEQRASHGLYADVKVDGIQLYDQTGKPVYVHNQSGTGLLASTLNAATRLPIWIVTGTDEAGIAQVINRMNPAKAKDMEGYFGAIVTETEIIRLPIRK